MPKPLPFGHVKLFPFEVKAVDAAARTVEGFVNIPTADRANEIVNPEAFLRAWDGSWSPQVMAAAVMGPPAPYRLNPLYTYNHDFWAPVGVVTDMALQAGKPWYKALIGKANLGSVDPDQLLQAIAEGTIRTSSFGYNELAVDEPMTPGQPRVIQDFEQLDTSAVSIPCNAYATVEMAKSLGLSLAGIDLKAATPFADLPLADEGMAWSFSAADGTAVLGDPEDWGRYKEAHFWFDPENARVRAGYKMPFAKMDGGTLKAVWRGCAAAMAVLMGGRGGVDIPEADRKGVYNHIGRYYKKFDKPMPQMAGAPLEEALAKGVWPDFGDITWKAGENVLLAEAGFEDDLQVLKSRVGGAVRIAPFLAKIGRVLSGTNRQIIEDAIATLRALLEAADAGTSNGVEEPRSDGQAGEAELEAALACLEPGVAATLKTTIRRNQALRGALHG